MAMRFFLVLFFLLFAFISYGAEEVTNIEIEETAPSINFLMKQDKGSIPNISRILFWLSALLVITYLVIFLLKRFIYQNKQIFPESSFIEVIASKKIALKTVVHIIKIENVKYIVAEKESTLSILLHTPSEGQKLKNQDQMNQDGSE